jgi:hypothetical protein
MVEANQAGPTGIPEVAKDPLVDDPFFRLPAGSLWNACIGKQGSEENYLDGYIEAATALVSTVIEKNMLEKRDTVVLPILYNARHAVELTQKLALDRLAAAGVLSRAAPRNHDISGHWQLLNNANLGDEELRRHVRALEPFVASLSRIDDDGQELRYHLNRDEGQSLSTYSLANLEVIRVSLADLSKVISDLKYRITDFIDERRSNAYTSRVSRRDLICIAKLLPPLDRWMKPIFDETKQIVKSRFNLSSRQFSDAINVIKGNREMKALVGGETSLLYLPDKTIVWIMEQWRKLHPPRKADDGRFVVTFDEKTFEAMKENSRTQAEVVLAVEKRLTDQQVAGLQAMYYLGRDGWFPEHYEDYVEKTIKQHVIDKDPRKQIDHLLSKTNLLSAVMRALPRLGRPSLSARLFVL